MKKTMTIKREELKNKKKELCNTKDNKCERYYLDILLKIAKIYDDRFCEYMSYDKEVA